MVVKSIIPFSLIVFLEKFFIDKPTATFPVLLCNFRMGNTLWFLARFDDYKFNVFILVSSVPVKTSRCQLLSEIKLQITLVRVQAKVSIVVSQIKVIYSETSIKRTLSVKRTLSRVAKVTSYISLCNESLFSRHLYYTSLRTEEVSPRSSPLRDVSRWARRNVCRSQATITRTKTLK